jgi:hypothetical protein
VSKAALLALLISWSVVFQLGATEINMELDYTKAQFHYNNKRYNQALEHLKTTLALKPDHLPALGLMAEITYQKSGRKALFQLYRKWGKSIRKVELHSYLAQVMMKTYNITKDIRVINFSIKQITKAKAKSRISYYRLGQLYFIKKSLKRSYNYFRRTIKMSPSKDIIYGKSLSYQIKLLNKMSQPGKALATTLRLKKSYRSLNFVNEYIDPTIGKRAKTKSILFAGGSVEYDTNVGSVEERHLGLIGKNKSFAESAFAGVVIKSSRQKRAQWQTKLLLNSKWLHEKSLLGFNNYAAIFNPYLAYYINSRWQLELDYLYNFFWLNSREPTKRLHLDYSSYLQLHLLTVGVKRYFKHGWTKIYSSISSSSYFSQKNSNSNNYELGALYQSFPINEQLTPELQLNYFLEAFQNVSGKEKSGWTLLLSNRATLFDTLKVKLWGEYQTISATGIREYNETNLGIKVSYTIGQYILSSRFTHTSRNYESNSKIKKSVVALSLLTHF